jgi:hypothetical protein
MKAGLKPAPTSFASFAVKFFLLRAPFDVAQGMLRVLRGDIHFSFWLRLCRSGLVVNALHGGEL